MKTTMTMTELDSILKESSNAIDLGALALQDMLNADGASQKEINEIRNELKANLDKYNETAKQKVYLGCYEFETPMLKACQYGEMTKKTVKEVIDENGVATVSVVDRKTRNAIDLVDFEKSYDGKGTLARNAQWPVYAESLLKAMVKSTAAALEVDEATQKKLNEAYKDAKENGTYANLSATKPSKANMIKDLQSIVDCIVFTPFVKDGKEDNTLNALKVTSADVAYVQIRIAKAGKRALSTRVASKKEMVSIVSNVMYHLTTGKAYEMEVKAAK